MIAWYSRARSSFNSSANRSREMLFDSVIWSYADRRRPRAHRSKYSSAQCEGSLCWRDYLPKRCSDIPCSGERGFARIIDHDQRVLKLHCPTSDQCAVRRFPRLFRLVLLAHQRTDRLRHGRIRTRQLRVGQRKSPCSLSSADPFEPSRNETNFCAPSALGAFCRIVSV